MQTDGTTGNILIVDDNPSNVKILKERLEGYVLATAASGEEALEVAPSFRPDLILLDIMMPGIDGYEVCRRVREHPDLAHTKIIMVTAKAMRDERLEGYAAGADDYMVKPFDGQELLAKVRVYLRLKSTEEFNRQLAGEVEARTRDHRLAKEAAEQANEAKNRFISVMTHELRNPLTAIMGYASMLRDNLPAGADEDAGQSIDRILEGAHFLSALVADIFDVVKIDRNVVDLRITAFPADDFVHATLDMLRARAREKDLTLGVKIDPAVTRITGDRRRCTQVLTNLLTNAIKYTDRGGRIDVAAYPVGADAVAMTVRDTGVGIAEEHLGHVFAEFYQVDRERDESLGGTGIGLALVRRLVELHGGTIAVESTPGEGSTFRFILPLVPDAEPDSSVAETGLPVLPRAISGRCVLVAEDDRATRAFLLDALDRSGVKVVTASDGQEAVEMARYHRPDLVLMDLGMPVMDGFAAVEKLRSLPAFAGTPIVALSGSADPHTVEQSVAAGCNEHLAKPVTLADLRQVLHRYLGGE